MKTNSISIAIISSILGAALVIGAVTIQRVFAQVDAVSSDSVASTSATALPLDSDPGAFLGDSTSSEEAINILAADGSKGAPTETATTSDTDSVTDLVTDTVPATVEPSNAPAMPPTGLMEVHIIGTKYIDYFTDGTTTTAYPGDPQIDGNFDKPNAPIPTHEGLTWVHTTGQYLYDTPSGDLEVGDYAVLPTATYITNAPPFVRLRACR